MGEMPPSPLDDLLIRLGGPQNVAEISGRSRRIVRASGPNGRLFYTKRMAQDPNQPVTRPNAQLVQPSFSSAPPIADVARPPAPTTTAVPRPETPATTTSATAATKINWAEQDHFQSGRKSIA